MQRAHLIFDLDNTLYPSSLGVVARVDVRINQFMIERLGLTPDDVDAVRERYRREHGTTLNGLLRHHRIDPDDYLASVHAIELDDLLMPDAALHEVLERLPHEKVVFTNGSTGHAERVLARLAVRQCFARVFALEQVAYVPKPQPAAFRSVVDALGAHIERCVLIDDDRKNLRTARALGMRTVLVGDGGDQRDADLIVRSVLELAADTLPLAPA